MADPNLDVLPLPGELGSLQEGIQTDLRSMRAQIRLAEQTAIQQNSPEAVRLALANMRLQMEAPNATRQAVIQSIDQQLVVIQQDASLQGLRDRLNQVQGALRAAQTPTESLTNAGSTIVGAGGTITSTTYKEIRKLPDWAQLPILGGAVVLSTKFINWVRKLFGAKEEETKKLDGIGKSFGKGMLWIGGFLGLIAAKDAVMGQPAKPNMLAAAPTPAPTTVATANRLTPSTETIVSAAVRTADAKTTAEIERGTLAV